MCVNIVLTELEVSVYIYITLQFTNVFVVSMLIKVLIYTLFHNNNHNYDIYKDGINVNEH